MFQGVEESKLQRLVSFLCHGHIPPFSSLEIIFNYIRMIITDVELIAVLGISPVKWLVFVHDKFFEGVKLQYIM